MSFPNHTFYCHIRVELHWYIDMVAVQPNQIPASVNTVEKLVVWGSAILAELHFQQEVQEAPGVVEKVATSQPFPTNINGQYGWRIASRTSIPIQPTWQQGGKLWTYAQDLSNASIPSNYTSA